MLNVMTKLKETQKKGIGLFANEMIKKGTIVHFDETFFDKEYSIEFVKKYNFGGIFRSLCWI
jgi:hypothetical protein